MTKWGNASVRLRSIAFLLSSLAPFSHNPAIAFAPTIYPSSPSSPAALPTFASDPTIDALMVARGGAPIWFRGPGSSVAIEKLIAILRRAPLDGFPSGPRLADQISTAVRDAQSGDVAAINLADRRLSSAWLAYVAALDGGASELTYADPSLVIKGTRTSVTLMKLASAASLPDHLETVSAVNPVYAGLRDAAWTSLQRTGSTPDQRLLRNLARARALPRTGRFIVVNSATQRLTMVENGRVADSMKVIVGTPKTPTPMLASMIWYVTRNPYWYVPTDLTQRIVAARMQANPNYLNVKNYKVISDFGETPTVLSPKGIDWKAVQAGKTTVYLRQLPGEGNSMGKMKFSFPSETGVYLHDTDLRGLFTKDPRLLSNGCVRLEDAQRLGRWLMGREVTAGTGVPEEHLVLPQGVPVFLTYITAQVENGKLVFAPDVYGRDAERPTIASAS